MKVYSNHYYTKTVCKGGPHSIMATGYILIHPYKKTETFLQIVFIVVNIKESRTLTY
jgi:hypothetical protein